MAPPVIKLLASAVGLAFICLGMVSLRRGWISGRAGIIHRECIYRRHDPVSFWFYVIFYSTLGMVTLLAAILNR